MWRRVTPRPLRTRLNSDVVPPPDPSPKRARYSPHRGDPRLRQAVMRPTTRRTQGATTSTAGNATGQVVTQLLNHCAGNPAPLPWAVARTKAATMATIMAESSAPKRIGAKRAEIRISISVKKYKSSRPNKRWCGGPPSRRVQEVDDPAGGIEAKPENPVSEEALKPGGGRARRAARGDTGTHARLHHQERQRDGSDADR